VLGQSERDRQHRMKQAKRCTRDGSEADTRPQRRALVDGEPAREGAQDHDALDAEIEHSRALAQQHTQRTEDEWRGDPQHGDPERDARDDVENVAGHFQWIR